MVRENTSSFEPKPFGRYVLLDKLAVGGMAEIYKAKTYGIDGFEKLLAIKRILPHCSADREFINMLVDEAKLTVLLSHANIVQVYDLGKVGDDYFISMEFIYGTNLREFINRFHETGERIPEAIAVYIISEACKGLDYAHRKTDNQGKPLNIVHRDISPQNILISYEGEVKIVDFGIAKAAMNVSHTMAGILKGKVAYMSPEQALGKPIDHRTDIFSAGVLLYELLTSDKLFSGETQFEVLNQIRTTRINTLMLPDHIPGPLKAIIAKALAYNIKDRYQSAGDLQLDLTKYLYSSYVDFSPRHLAELLRKIFETEIKKKETPESHIEQTSSAILQASLEDHTTDHAMEQVVSRKAEVRTSTQASTKIAEAAPQKTEGVAAVREKKEKRLAPLLIGAGILLFALMSGYAGYHFFLKGRSPQPSVAPVKIPSVPTEPGPNLAEEMGSVVIDTNPQGAKILLNEKETGLVTPATVSQLALGDEYRFHLVKDNYRDLFKTIVVTSSQPSRIQENLQPLPKGVIEIDSSPKGAKVVLNDTETAFVTPARIENLEVMKSYNLKLKIPNYYEWSSAVELKNFDPVKLQANLIPQPPAPQPPPLTPPQPTPQPQPQPQPTPQPPATPVYGKIKVTSSPSGATILVNGDSTGKTTPATLDHLDAGKKVTISLSLSGYNDWSRTVAVQGDKTTPLVAPLQEIAKPTPPTPSPIPTPTPSPPPEEPAVGGTPGTLMINSDPSGADVYVNSELKGTTPVKVASVMPGSVKITISKEGFMRYNTTVRMGSGENKNLGTIRLGGQFGEVSLNSSPPRATVYFDGEKIGARTPVTIRKVPREKSHTIKLELDGFRPWQSTVNLQNEESKKYDVQLERN